MLCVISYIKAVHDSTPPNICASFSRITGCSASLLPKTLRCIDHLNTSSVQTRARQMQKTTIIHRSWLKFDDDDEYGNLANMGMGGGEDSSSDDSDDEPIDSLEVKPKEDNKEDDEDEMPPLQVEQNADDKTEDSKDNDKTNNDAPLLVKYDLERSDNGHMQFYLAPKIE